MLTFLENIIAYISENHIFRISENIIDKSIENLVAFSKTLAGIFYFVVRRTMLNIYIICSERRNRGDEERRDKRGPTREYK